MIDLKPYFIGIVILFTIFTRITRQYLGLRLNITSWEKGKLRERINKTSNRKERLYLKLIIVLIFMDYLNFVLITIFLVIPILLRVLNEFINSSI